MNLAIISYTYFSIPQRQLGILDCERSIMTLQTTSRFHFIGIGGIGMSGIAKIMKMKGFSVSGSDLKETQLEGITTFQGHDAAHLEGVDVVITSSDIPPHNVEILEAQKKGLPILKRADMLAEIMRLFDHTVSISGTHGKTTTTALVGAILQSAGFNPTVINGGVINQLNSNIHLGQTDAWCVVEADESDGSFLKLLGTYSVVTNINTDHLNYYGSFDNLKTSFKEFIMRTSIFGGSIVCLDDPIIREMLPINRKVITYGVCDDAMVQAFNIRKFTDKTLFDVRIRMHITKIIQDVELSILGHHNVLNALSVISLAQLLKIDDESLIQGLKHFHGIQRRFTIRGIINGVTVVDDYAVHPKEINAILDIAYQKGFKSIVAVFQPHRYSRLQILMKEFAKALNQFSHVIIAPVYAAFEKEIEGVNSDTLSQMIDTPHTLIQDSAEISPLLKTITTPGDLVIFIGAGTVSEWSKQYVANPSASG